MSKHQIRYFSQNPKINHPRSRFDRSKGFRTTFDAGYLIPCFVDQMVPGDTLILDLEALARLATPIKPTMDNLYLETFFFFIPSRLVWDNFQKYMGEQENPGDSIDYLRPQMSTPDSTGIAVMSLFDYFDIVPGVQNLSFRADIGRCYNLTWNQWFRDENLQDSVVVDKGDGPDDITDYVLLRRGKRPDYFTTCMLTPQKGPTVMIPGSDMPVKGFNLNSQTWDNRIYARTSTASDVTIETNGSGLLSRVGGDNNSTVYWQQEGGAVGSNSGVNMIDWSDNVDGTMNALRMAEAMQVFYERQMRGGSRYIEQVKYQFGVTSPDARLQRVEFLGGGSTRINISPIAQQSDTGAGTPQGNLAGVGTAHVRNHGFTRSFTEHGIVLGLMSVRADLSYQNVLPRWYTIRSRDEEYFPPFANLGDQAVLISELYCNGAGYAAETVWGYQERFAEYKTALSTITGLFRSNVSGSLDVWHYAIDLDSEPELGDAYIQDNPPIDRTIAVPSQPHFLFDGVFRITHVRPIPAHSNPGIGVRL